MVNPDWTLGQFAFWYRDNNYPHMPELMRSVFLTDVSTSTLVYSSGPFLVEHYLMHPNAIVVPHAHPFESCSIFIGGLLLGTREGAEQEPTWMTDADSGAVTQPLPIGKWHAFKVGPQGAVFCVASRWDNPDEKDSATRKYFGMPLGPLHAQSLDGGRS